MAASRLLRFLIVLCGLLVCIVTVTVYVHRPQQKAPFQHRTGTAQQIVLRTGRSHVQLNRDSGGWTVATDSDTAAYAADKNKVSSLLGALEELRVEDEISSRADRLSDFEADDLKGLDITLLGKNGARLAEGIFGKQAPDFTHIYFRYPGRPAVYLARGAILGELGGSELTGWRSHELWSLPENQVQAILIQGPGYQTPLVRSSDTWSANGVSLDPGKAFSLVGILAHLRADDFVDPAQRPDLTPDKLTYATITIQTSAGNHLLRIGRMDKATRRYPVAVDSSPNLAWLNQSSAESLLKSVSYFKK